MSRALEHSSRMRFVRSLLPEKLQGKLLDIGCYVGELGNLLPKEVEYYGLDIKEGESIMAWNLNTSKLPYDSEFFDYIICTDVLEHLFYPEQVCKEMVMVLKPTGLAVISLPNGLGILGRYEALFKPSKTFEEQRFYHHWFFTIDIARSFVSRYFDIIEEKPYVGHKLGRFIPQSVLNLWPGLCSCWFMKVVHKNINNSFRYE